MRFGRNPVGHFLIITVVLAVAIFGVKTNGFGIRRHHSSDTSVIIKASPVPLATQERILSTARTLRQQGQYEEAIASLSPVIALGNPATAGAALLEQAKNHIALGNDNAAIDALKAIRREYPESPESDQAQFHIGQLEGSQGNLAAAVLELRNYRKRHPEISPYVDLLLAGFEEQRGDFSNALALAQSVASRPVASRTEIDALEKTREIQQKTKDYVGYLDITNRLLSIATVPSYRAELIYQRASAELHLGQKDTALTDLRTVLRKYPDSPYAGNAIEDLVKLIGTTAVTDEQRGLVDYYRGDYQSAAQIFNRILSINSTSGTAWYYRAMSTLHNGDSWTAAVQLSAMPNKFPNNPLTPKALYTAGKLYEEEGDLSSAQSTYETLIEKAPRTVEATEGRLRLGIVRYQQGDYQGVISVLSPVHGTAAAQAQASFWEGKAYQELGRADRAAQAWNDAALSDPTGFYGLRSNEMLFGQAPAISDHSNAELKTSLSKEDRAELASWFAFNGTTEDAARAAVQRDPNYVRMDLLFELGLSTQAGWEMSDLADRYDRDPASLATLGELLDEAGHFNAAYRVGIRLQLVSDNNGIRLPRALQRLAYPIAFPALVEVQVSNDAVDPYLFLALMRQESGYDPTATSAANARGLTQVVPATAAELAASLHIDNWSADKLYRPAIAVQLGAVFLADRLQKYDGQIYPALAGYNAGDGNVASWTSIGGIGDPDVFVERIPFPETHDYVETVYANYLNYLRIYR